MPAIRPILTSTAAAPATITAHQSRDNRIALIQISFRVAPKNKSPESENAFRAWDAAENVLKS